MQNPNALHSLFIWKYNTRSGLWDMQRDVSPETRERWLNIFKKDEPNADFLVAKHRPKNAPVKSEGAMTRLTEAIKQAEAAGWVDDLFNEALPGLEKRGFGVGRPGKYGEPVFTIQLAPSTQPQIVLDPEHVLKFWQTVKGKGRMPTADRRKAMDSFKK